MADNDTGLRRFQEALRNLERRAEGRHRRRGLAYSRREVAKAVNDNAKRAAEAAGVEFRGKSHIGQRLSEWLPNEGQAKAPRNADLVWELVQVLAAWAGEKHDRGDWARLVDAAQPRRRPQSAGPPATDEPEPLRLTGLPVPYLTEHFLPRPDVEARAIAALLGPASGARGAIVALTGMSGSGKTLSAQWVASRSEIGARFPNGVLWVDARTATTTAHWQRAILRCLGEPAPEDDGQLRSLLHDRLANLRCLIVLDNLGPLEPGDGYNVIDPGSAILATTTDQDALPDGTQICPVDQFDEAGSREMLRRYAGGADPLPDAAAKVVTLCGGLGLALAICGAMVGHGHDGAVVAALLEEADLDLLRWRFRDYPQPSLLAALTAGLAVLEPRERAAYGALAVFAGQGAVPVAAVARLWARQGLTGPRVRAMLVGLARRSLLTLPPERTTFRVHDLLNQVLVAEAGADLAGWHAGLAGDYLRDWGGLNAGLPEADESDEYGVTRLARHLEHGGADDLLHELLALETSDGNRWFALHDRGGWTAQYAATVNRAGRRAAGAADKATGDRRAYLRALEMRYALISGSLAGIAACVPAPLVSALVRVGEWTFAQAVAHCGMIADPIVRAAVLAALTRHRPLGDNDLLAQAVVAASALPGSADRGWRLATLIPFAPDHQRANLFRAAVAAVRGGSKPTLAWLAARLTSHLPDLAGEVLREVAARERLLAVEMHALALAVRHVPGLRMTLRTRIRALEKPGWRLCLTVMLLPGAEPDERATLLADASADTQGQDLLTALLAYTGDRTFRQDGVTAYLDQAPAGERPAALDAIVDRATNLEVDEAVRLIRTVLPHWPEPDRHALVTRILGPDLDMHTLRALAPYLPETALARAAELACAEPLAADRAAALSDLAPHLTANLLRRSLATVTRLDTPLQRSKALVRLAAHLPVEDRHHSLAAVAAVDRPDDRLELLIELAPLLPPEQLATVPGLVPAGAEPILEFLIWTLLAMLAVEPEAEQWRGRALGAAHRVPSRPELSALLDGVTDPSHLWAAMMLRQRLDDWRRYDLATLELAVPKLPDLVVDRAVRAAEAMADACDRSHAYASLVLCTSGQRQEEMLRESVAATRADHHHPDMTDCRIEPALNFVTQRAQTAERLPDKSAEIDDPWSLRWRPALTEAAANGRGAVLATAVDACLAVEPAAAGHLLHHILAVQRWWPGGAEPPHQPFVNAAGQGLAEVLAEFLRSDHTREPWLSDTAP